MLNATEIRDIKGTVRAVRNRLEKLLPRVGDGPDIEVDQLVRMLGEALEQFPSDDLLRIERAVVRTGATT